jgi:hypothetical protein
MEPVSSVLAPFDLVRQGCNHSLGLSEAFVVWQSIKVQRTKHKHAFLVFALERGQLLYGHEYRFIRVERLLKQAAAGSSPSEGQAYLNICFCK